MMFITIIFVDNQEEVIMTAITSELSTLLPSQSLRKHKWHMSSDIVTVGFYSNGFLLPSFPQVQLIFQYKTHQVRHLKMYP